MSNILYVLIHWLSPTVQDSPIDIGSKHVEKSLRTFE